jgi:hypothetical protein
MEPDLDTTDSVGEDAWRVNKDYEAHAQNVEDLAELAKVLQEHADSMKVNYDETAQIGSLTLYVEYDEDED